MSTRVDLNADVGSSFGRWRLGNDESLVPLLTSVNICCGYHAGDPHVMRSTVRLALRHDIAIGAHVGLPDLMGYGLRRIDVSPEDLKDYIVYQVGALLGFIRVAGGRLQHVKPHGAMYHMAARDERYARAVAEAVAEVDPDCILLLSGEAALRAGEASGVRVRTEGYVDFDYAPDGSLVIERPKKPMDPEHVAVRAVRLVREGRIQTIAGTDLALQPESICVHGDAPNAAEIARAIRNALEAAGVQLVPLALL